MNMKLVLGLLIIIGAIIAILLTEGLLLPIGLPLFFYGAKLMGLKLE